MSERLYVGTRKGLFELRRNAAGQWLPMASHFLGEPLSMLLADPRDGALYAALNLGHFGVKLWRRDAGATDWKECAVPVYPPQPPAAEPLEGQAAEPPWSLQQLWILEPGGADRPGTLWAGTIPGGLFRSDDRGASWRLNRELWERPERAQWFGGGYDHPGIHSICVDPRDSRHLTVAVSCGGVWQSHDDGRSWTCTTRGMRADYMPPEQSEEAAIQDPRDGGRSFETLERGLPDGPAYDLVYRHGLDIDPSGERLAMGSTTGGLWLSENGGEDWRQLSANLPPIYCVRFA